MSHPVTSRRMPLDSTAAAVGHVGSPDSQNPQRSAAASMPRRRPRRTVSAAYSAAVLAEYDPTWYERQRGPGRGIPDAWPFCECGREACPDRGLTHDAP
jgi:hypothetical protein